MVHEMIHIVRKNPSWSSKEAVIAIDKVEKNSDFFFDYGDTDNFSEGFEEIVLEIGPYRTFISYFSTQPI